MSHHPTGGRSGPDRIRPKSGDKIDAVLNGPDMLTPDQIANRLGVSRETVDGKRRRGELLGVGGGARGFRFPDWQIDADSAQPVPGVDRVVAACRGDRWRAYRVLRQPHAELDGETGLAALKDGRIDGIRNVIENIERGQFA